MTVPMARRGSAMLALLGRRQRSPTPSARADCAAAAIASWSDDVLLRREPNEGRDDREEQDSGADPATQSHERYSGAVGDEHFHSNDERADPESTTNGACGFRSHQTAPLLWADYT